MTLAPAMAIVLAGAPVANAAEYEITAASFTVDNQLNVSSATYYGATATTPASPAAATQLTTPGGLYFDGARYRVWDAPSNAWVSLATATAAGLLPWSELTAFPPVCPAGQFVTGLGAAPACSASGTLSGGTAGYYGKWTGASSLGFGVLVDNGGAGVTVVNASTLTVTGSAFSVGGSTLVVAGGNVGVGTASPATKLHMSSGTLTVDGNAATGLQVYGSTFVVNSNGNVGIGSSNPGTSAFQRSVMLSNNTPLFWRNGVDNDNGGGIWVDGSNNLILGEPEGNGWPNAIIFQTGVPPTTTERMRLDSKGELGIGTTGPATPLDVNGAAQFGSGVTKSTFSAAGGLTFAAGFAPAGAQDAATKNYVDTKLLSGGGPWTRAGAVVEVSTPTDNVLVQSTLTVQGNAFSVGGSTLVVTGGNVGVGTASPSSKFHVSDSVATPGGVIALVQNTSPSAGFAQFTSSAGPVQMNLFAEAGGTGGLGTNSNYPVYIRTNGLERMRIDATGNVGIKTSSPDTDLNVVASGGPNLRIGNVGCGANAGLSAFTPNCANYAIAAGDGNTYINRNTGSGIHFREGNGTDQMIVAAGGNVGIGTSGPVNKLQISGTGNTSVDLAVNGRIMTGDANNAGGVWLNTGQTGFVGAAPPNIGFWTPGQGWSTLAISTTTGNVGVGTTAPGGPLDVAGTAYLRKLLTTGNNVYSAADSLAADLVVGSNADGGTRHNSSIMFWSVGSASRIFGQSDIFYFSPWNADAVTGANVALAAAVGGTSYFQGNVGIGTTAPANPLQMGSGAFVSPGGVWTNASSRSYKENVADLPLDRALDALRGLDPVTFRYKKEPRETHVGFIAEDVPELLATKDRKGLSAMDIVAVLTKVVQGQQEALQRQQAEIERLDADNKLLRAETRKR